MTLPEERARLVLRRNGGVLVRRRQDPNPDTQLGKEAHILPGHRQPWISADPKGLLWPGGQRQAGDQWFSLSS